MVFDLFLIYLLYLSISVEMGVCEKGDCGEKLVMLKQIRNPKNHSL